MTPMLEPLPNRWVMLWFDRWCVSALRNTFARVHLYPDTDDAQTGDASFDPTRPRLYVANHSSFWDGIVLNVLVRKFRRQPLFCMVDLVQVRRHPFFRRVGCFSVDRSQARHALQSLGYATRLLNGQVRPKGQCDPRHAPAVVMFPQGKVEPVDNRPLQLESGVARIIENVPGLEVVPVALRYDFWTEQRAECLIRLGRAQTFVNTPRASILQTLTDTLTTLSDDLARASRAQQTGPVVLLTGKTAVNKRRIGP